MIMYDFYITNFVNKAYSIVVSPSAEVCLSLFDDKRLFTGGKGGWK